MQGFPGQPPGLAPGAQHCARCRRRIGTHLSFPDPDDARAGTPSLRRICYRCHRLAQWGRLPRLLEDLGPSPRSRATQFLLYRFSMVLLAAITLLTVVRTGRAAHFFFGLAGVILLLTLSIAVRPGRKPLRRPAPPDEDAGAAERVDGPGDP